MKKLKNFIDQYTKHKNNVYIIPSSAGLKFVGINFFLFLIAVTYANNLALLISFIMVMFFILQMFSTHRIIHSIDMDQIHCKDQFINYPHFVNIHLKKYIPDETLKYIQIELMEKERKLQGHFSKNYENQLSFQYYVHHRGYFHFNRIKFFTFGPGGLFYVWRYYKIELPLYIYPEKRVFNQQKLGSSPNSKIIFSESEFSHHIRFQQGMSTKRIDWKVYAKSDQLYWKNYIDYDTHIYEVNYKDFAEDKEVNLSYMSYLIDKYYLENKTYKVILPNKIVKASKGPQHFKNSLETISVF